MAIRDKVNDVLYSFIPRKGYFITPVMVYVNILIFILMVFSGVDIMAPDTQSLIDWGADFRPVTLDGQWWRLLSACFLHIGLFHLLMNMYALVYIGLLLEPLLGRIRYLSAYLLAGIGGSVASVFWHDFTVSAGASGAIFGMYGLFLAMLTTNLVEKSARNTLLSSILVFVGYNLLFGLSGGVDNAAHIGGLVTGMIIGYAFYPSLIRPSKSNLKYGTVALLTVFVLGVSFFILKQIPNDIGKYNKEMEKFSSYEDKAIFVINNSGNIPHEELLNSIKSRGINYWQEGIKIIREADKLDLPVEIHTRNKKLIEYCELRIKSYELYYKAVDENTDKYQSEIQEYEIKIEAIIKQINEEME